MTASSPARAEAARSPCRAYTKGGHGKVRLAVVENRRKALLQSNVRHSVARGSQVYTDELLSYDGPASGFTHNVINHAEAYVDGEVRRAVPSISLTSMCGCTGSITVAPTMRSVS